MSVIGSVMGDVIGSRYEFTMQRPKDFDWKTARFFSRKNDRTDDTVLTLATKAAILDNQDDPFFEHYYYDYGNFYPDCSYGEGFEDWLHSQDHSAYCSIGNGSAMRVSFVGCYYKTQKEVIEKAIASAQVTHNSIAGVKGAVVTAMCNYIAKKGGTKEDILKYAEKYYSEGKCKYPVTMTLAELRKKYKWSDRCQDSVPVAIRCFYESTDWKSFMRNVMSLDCDMDTIGAIGGSIAEEYYHGTGIDITILQEYLEPELYELMIKGEQYARK